MVAAVALAALPCFASGETLSVDLGHNGQIDKVIVSHQGHSGLAEIYENGVAVGKFANLIVDQPAISSDVVALAGGGLAVEIESIGSRDKYRVISPISKESGRFYVDCNYKTVYDSMDETRSVGTSCKRVELGKFDVSSAIADDGLMLYSQYHGWIKKIALSSCRNAVGLEYGSYRIVRCAPGGVADAEKQKIIVFDRHDELLFSVYGYELIPRGDGSGFVLSADLPDRAVNFEGNLACVSRTRGARNNFIGKAKIGGKLEINYTLTNADGCVIGNYAYIKNGMDIELTGMQQGGLTYLLELTSSKASTGLFILDQLTDGMRGAWIGMPPKRPLTIN